VRAVELRRDALQGLGAWLPVCVARMEVVQPDAERLAAAQVVEEAGVGLLRLGGVGGREVDEVGAVRQDGGGGEVRVLGAKGGEGGGMLGLEWGVVPLALGLEEEGEGVAADAVGVGDGVVDTCMRRECQWYWSMGLSY